MSNATDSYTFRLFKGMSPMPFVDGMAAVLDMWDTDLTQVYNYDSQPDEADGNSLRDDWRQVGIDLDESMKNYASSASKSE